MTIVRYDKEKKVTRIAPTQASAKQETTEELKNVAAYCRVSTDEEDQINSYEIQQRKYTEKIMAEPGWKMVGIYADKGITGTSRFLDSQEIPLIHLLIHEVLER